MGTGPSGATLPCLPSGALGQCPGYQPASPETAAMSLLPSRKARNEAEAVGPTPKPLKASPAQGLSLWPRGPRRRP